MSFSIGELILLGLLGFAVLFLACSILVAVVYAVSKAATRGRIDGWMDRLRQAKRRKQ